MIKDGRLPDTSRQHTRRDFLKAGIAGGVLAAVSPVYAAQEKMRKQQAPAPEVGRGELDEATIGDLADAMKSGRYTSRAITERYLSRIEAMDRNGPGLHSVIELYPDALAIADAMDAERREKGPRGPLHGIPVLIKDNIDTADRMSTTAGSLALVGSRPPADAFLVRRLRGAGAVLLGKTNLSEWANIRSNHSTSGWSGRGGLTKNPYALDRNTPGSSSGSGAADSANLGAVAVGTETDGSIVSPSSINGIVGIKPTVGLVSRTGIVPISHSQDTAGPMARTVRDAAILLGVLAEPDPEDAATGDASRSSVPDYTVGLQPDGLRGARIGVVRRYLGYHPGVDAMMNEALDLLKSRGAILVDPADIDTIGKFDDTEFTVLLYELKADMAAYLARLGPGAPVHTLNDIIQYNDRHASEEMPYFGQETFLKADEKGGLSSKEYIDALAANHRLARTEGIDAVMDKFKLDALVAPTDAPAWLTDLVDGDHFLGGSSTAAAVAGYPSITVPAGFVFGLPVGVSFFGRAWSESSLIRLAYAFEQATLHRKPPRFLPTVDLRGRD